MSLLTTNADICSIVLRLSTQLGRRDPGFVSLLEYEHTSDPSGAIALKHWEHLTFRYNIIAMRCVGLLSGQHDRTTQIQHHIEVAARPL